MPLDETVLCENCLRVEVPMAMIRNVLVCRSCGASLVMNSDGSTRKATAVDVGGLSTAEFQELNRARAGIVRSDRRGR